MSEQRYFLRRQKTRDGKKYLIWHSYASKQKRDAQAAHYVRQGDLIWLNEDGSTDNLYFVKDEDAINYGKSKVYVVTYSDYDLYGIDSVWTTQAAAEARVATLDKSTRHTRLLYDWDEWDVDVEL